MSILVADADESATLEATLAFLDAWDAPATDSNGADSPLLNAEPSRAALRCLTPSPQQQDHHSQPSNTGTKRKKPRRRYPNSSSTVLQRRKKVEILTLRTQVEQLELELQQFKKVPGKAAVAVEEQDLDTLVPGIVPVTWAEQAAVQYRCRLQAEKTNTKLKSIMAKQVKVSEALRTVLQKTSALEGLDFLQQDPRRPLCELSFSMELLEQRVESLYLHADSVYKPEELQGLGLRANVRESDALGKVLEIVSTTPMMCSVAAASEVLWKWFSLSKSLRDRPNTLERSYSMLLESQIGTLEVKKKNFVRRYEEADRVIIVWSDILQLPKYGLQFRNQAWLFITPSSDAPKDKAVLRTFQQLFVDCEGNQPLPNACFVQAPAFEELVKLYQRFLQSQHNIFIDETAAKTPEVAV